MRHCGLRIADCGLALIVTLVLASPALAQGVDVTASLDITDGLARVGAYVPVTFKATNRTGEEIASVHITTGGPVDVKAEWRLAPGETGEKVLPIFYVGGDLALAVEFLDADGDAVARAKVTPPEVRALPYDTALAWLGPNVPEPDEDEREALCRRLGAARLRVLRKGPVEGIHALKCQLVDVLPFPIPDSGGRYSLEPFPSLPSRIRTVVKPGAYALMSAGDSAAADPVHVWLWLAILAGLVLAIGVAVPRRRAAWAAVALGGLGLVAAAGVWFAGGGPAAHLREARFAQWAGRSLAGPPERFILLQTRGGATARFPIPQDKPSIWPRPVFRSSDEFYRPAGVLVVGEDAAFETTRAVCLLHTLFADPFHRRTDWKRLAPDALAAVASRADVVAALLAQADRATDAEGRSQPLDAWAVQWQESDDPNVAYAGRSLKWWDSDRREGDRPFLLAWFHDPLPEGAGDGGTRERLPALVVYGDAPTQE